MKEDSKDSGKKRPGVWIVLAIILCACLIGCIAIWFMKTFVFAAENDIEVIETAAGTESELAVPNTADEELKDAFAQISLSAQVDVSDNSSLAEPVDQMGEEEAEEKYSISNISSETEGFDSMQFRRECPLSDVYSEPVGMAEFQCYYPDAVSYQWEIYDLNLKEWISPEEEQLREKENQGMIMSALEIEAVQENHELMVRCKIECANEESTTETASLYILDQSIKELSIEPFVTDGNRAVYVNEIPVNVIYADGTTQIIQGLNHLHFVEKEESADSEESEAGNKRETITTVITEQEYSYLEAEEKEVMFRYDNGEKNASVIDFTGVLIGKDFEPPIIDSVEISSFEVLNVDQPVPVTVTIMADDEQTPYPKLEYAFLPEGIEPQEEDWKQKNVFDVDITQNGMWLAYCRDTAGNCITAHQEIIAVDEKAPILSAKLEQETWCTETRLIVQAKDISQVQYCYVCMEAGIDSGWTTDDTYPVTQNGIWQIQARDAVGNIAQQEIAVTNIDRQAPVILNIRTKETKE